MQKFLKRQIDFWGSLIGLIVLAIPFATIAIAIKLDSKGPAFFRQERVGKDGKGFKIWKFRTMIEGAERHSLGAFTPENDPRITRAGRWIRRFSLDELPQLINVVKGEMSLVGPRPTLPSQTRKYNERQRKRLLVKPGITGWASINGRNTLTWPEKIELDLSYLENWSLWLDFYILLKTPIMVLRGEGLFLKEIDYILQSEEKPLE